MSAPAHRESGAFRLPNQGKRGAMRGEISDKVAFLLFTLSLAFLIFLSGTVVIMADVFPSAYVRDAYRAGTALYQKSTRIHDPLTSDLWRSARSAERGVTLHDPARAQDGLTLYSSGHAPMAMLIDMNGAVVHEWRKPYSEIWDKQSAAVKHPVPDDQTYFRKAFAFPNGDLLAVYDGVGDTPYGYGMVKLDADSRVLWKNLDHFHHSFDVGADGRIYGLTHAYRSDALINSVGYLVDHLAEPVLDDSLVVLSPDGEILKKISLIDALNDSPFRRLLWRVPSFSLEDPLHTNDVDLLDRDAAARLAQKVPVAREGQVLLSFRELATGVLALLDVEQEKIVWVLQGQWLAQHDADVLPNGNILVFDNRGHFGPGGQSRLAEIDPATGGVVWTYAGNEAQPFDSDIRSEQELLPNGNILITESNPGRIFEITRAGDIVWEYINPVRAGDGDSLVPVVSWAQRIDPDRLDVAFRGKLSAALQTTEVKSP